MQKLIKKNGQLEDFIPEKIKTSIDNSSCDVNLKLNQADLEIIVGDVVNILTLVRGVAGVTSSYEVMATVLTVLNKIGFKKVADSYYNGSKI